MLSILIQALLRLQILVLILVQILQLSILNLKHVSISVLLSILAQVQALALLFRQAPVLEADPASESRERRLLMILAQDPSQETIRVLIQIRPHRVFRQSQILPAHRHQERNLWISYPQVICNPDFRFLRRFHQEIFCPNSEFLTGPRG